MTATRLFLLHHASHPTKQQEPNITIPQVSPISQNSVEESIATLKIKMFGNKSIINLFYHKLFSISIR
jgi:hypothetical protein